MMSLHNTVEFLKKFGIASAIGLGGIIVLVIFFRIGVVVKNILFPPKIDPANQAYGKIPFLEFPQSAVDGEFTYTIDTLDGTLPELPDRLVIYPIVNEEPNLLNLETAKDKIAAMQMVDNTGNPLPEIPRGGPTYEWEELTGLQRKVVFDIVAMNFTITSEYLKSNTVLRANSFRNLTDSTAVVPTVEEFLNIISLLPEDLDREKTTNPNPEKGYTTKPQMFSIAAGELRPSTSLSNAQIIRVDLYQKDIEYKLTAGTNSNLTKFQEFEMLMPIMYPKPPHSTMNFLLGSGTSSTSIDVVEASFTHHTINLEPEEQATYPIKTAEEAFNDLQEGRAYIAAYSGGEAQILVNDVYLAYYLGEDRQEYLMPVVVFEGPDGFFAYVSAVKDEAME
jgi:hypothetical protein